ncbi:MAG: response regulator [Candidatus Omnitrophota bacterium]
MSETFYTTHEVSKFCNVYPTTVVNWINEGVLPAFTTPGGHRRIKKSDLIKLMRQNNMPLPEELKGREKGVVLVADDDPNILKMVETILGAEKDLETVIAKNGFEAGVLIYELVPDVILLDFLMPEVDGFEVCRRLRVSDKTKDIPVIAVTVLSSEKEIKKMYTSGVTDYISKPFKSKDLVEKVRKYIAVHEAQNNE